MSKYDEYKNTDLWKIIDGILNDLEENSDIQITTARKYVIGYFCENLQNEFQSIENRHNKIFDFGIQTKSP